MTHGSLFSGFGGFDMAAQWLDWENVFHCEIDEFGQLVLHYYWPYAELFPDIDKASFVKYANLINILSGGFPCQPYSQTGKRKGKADSRHKWPQMLRAIREIQPTWVVGENVRGITNWNRGMVFNEVQADLEAEGYEVTPFLLPAAGVNAPHERYRVFFIAYSAGNRRRKDGKQQPQQIFPGTSSIHHENGAQGSGTQGIPANTNVQGLEGSQINRIEQGHFQPERPSEKRIITNTDSNGFQLRQPGEDRQEKEKGEGERLQWKRFWSNFGRTSEQGIITDTEDERLQGSGKKPGSAGQEAGFFQGSRVRRTDPEDYWKEWPTQSPLCGRNDGLSSGLDVKTIFGKTKKEQRERMGITFSKWRRESLKGFGNAVVPQEAYQIFKAIQLYENQVRV